MFGVLSYSASAVFAFPRSKGLLACAYARGFVSKPFSFSQWSGQKSGGDSAVSSEFLIAGMIFHPSRVKS
jgi:hypothetical protein